MKKIGVVRYFRFIGNKQCSNENWTTIRAGCYGVVRYRLGKDRIFDAPTRCFSFPNPRDAFEAALSVASELPCENPVYFAYRLWNGPVVPPNLNPIDPLTGEVIGGGRVPAIGRPRRPGQPSSHHMDFACLVDGVWHGGDHAHRDKDPMHVLIWPNLDYFDSAYSDFDTTVVCVTCEGERS